MLSNRVRWTYYASSAQRRLGLSGRRRKAPRIPPMTTLPADCASLIRPTIRSYCAAARIGMCDLRKVRTRLIVRCRSSSGSFHG